MRQKNKILQLQKIKKFKNFHDQKRKKNDKNKKIKPLSLRQRRDNRKKIRSNQMSKKQIIRNSFILFMIKITYFFQLF